MTPRQRCSNTSLAAFLRTGLTICSLLLLFWSPARAVESVQLAWHGPQARQIFSTTESVTHVISWQMSSTLKKLAGSKADPTTILEARTREVVPDGSCVVEIEQNSRRYGGDKPKDTSVIDRTGRQTIADERIPRFGLVPAFGSLTDAKPSSSPGADSTTVPATVEPALRCDSEKPNASPLFEDAGDAALAEFPAVPLQVGGSWSFSRPIHVERQIGSGEMTYTDRLLRIEQRGSHRFAILQVDGNGRVDLVPDLKSKGFKTTTMSFRGTADFDLTDGVPGAQHYTGHAEWYTRVLFAHIGLIFDETYDAKPWSIASRS